MSAFLRRLGFRRLGFRRLRAPLGVPRLAIVGALVLGLLLGTALAFGLASSSTGLPFAFSAARLSTPSPRSGGNKQTVSEVSTGASGCGAHAPAVPGQSIAQTLNFDGSTRDYRLHVPLDYASNVHTPLLLAFHGHGDSAMGFERYTRLSRLADAQGFLVAYPQGARGPDGKTGWDTFRYRDPDTDDVGFVNALLTHLQETLCVDPQRIYATGFSNGGGFVSVLACDLSARIAAFVPVSGDYYPQPGGCHPSRPVSILEIHGTADTINPYDGSTLLGYPSVGQWLQAWATRDDCTQKPVLRAESTSVVVETWSGCQNATTVVHYRLIGVGHAWLAGATASAQPTPSKTHALAFDTPSAVWDFLATQSLPTPTASQPGTASLP